MKTQHTLIGLTLLGGVALTFAPATLAKGPVPLTRPNTKITLTDGNRIVVRYAKHLGMEPTLNPTVLQAALKRLAPKFHQDPVDARPYRQNGQVKIKPAIEGRSLNIPATTEQIAQTYSQNPNATRFSVVLNKKAPELTADRLQGINGVLSRVQTEAWQHKGRNHNVELASSLIDGSLVMPGETFSLNETVGKRTKARGFKEAIIFVDAEEVPGVGGGVSQVTGTLFNGAAEAGMRIDEAHFHSRPVSYLPLGYDATVAYGSKDMRFTNTTDSPVFIAMGFEDMKLTATFYGKQVPGRKYKLDADVQRLGPGRIDAQLYRLTLENGNVTNKEKLVTHAYRWEP